MSDDDDDGDDDGGDGVTVLIDFEQDITMIRLIENTFVPSNITVRAEILPAGSINDDDFEIALAKVRFWLETVVSRCIAFGRGNSHASKMLLDAEGRNNSNNLLMLTPFEPSDDHLAALFQAKFSALGAGNITFGSIEIRSSNMAGLLFRFIGNAGDILPDMDSWVGKHTFFDTPWWMRDDASTLDVIPADDADLTRKPAWAYNLDFLTQAIHPQNIVLRPDFKPQVIDGGKKDE